MTFALYLVKCKYKKEQKMTDKLLSPKQLANYLGVGLTTLASYRKDGVGPEYLKIGHLVRYRFSDVENWLKTKEKQLLEK